MKCKELAEAVIEWWEEHQYDTVTYNAGGGYVDEVNVFSETPKMVILAQKVITKIKEIE